MINEDIKDKIMTKFFWLTGSFIILLLFLILGYIFLKGISKLSLEFIFGMPKNGWSSGGIFPAIVGTFYIVFIALLFSVPIGVGTGIFLAEFVKESKLKRIIRVVADSLNAVPSIVYGLFGLVFFWYFLKDITGGPTILSAGLVLGFMTLPMIIRTSEIAIREVPIDEKMGSYALGATKLQTIKNISLRRALPGIITGILLSFGRAAGETAPIIFLVALNPVLPLSPYDPGNALAPLLYFLVSEATSERMKVANGIALILILIILISNYLTRLIDSYLTRNLRKK